MKLIKKLSFIFLRIFIIYLFIGLIYIVYGLNDKRDYYKVKNDIYNGKIKVKYNEQTNNFKSNKDNNSIQSYIDCYEYPIQEEMFTDEMKKKLNEIYNLFNDNNFSLSFAYEDLYTGLHISYNENKQYFTASTIKAPVILYLFKQVENEKIDLNKYITYTPQFYVEGSGSIQYESFGKQYKLKDLVEKTLVESDNVAYQMTASQVNRNDIKNFWEEKGADNFWEKSVWGNISAHDGVIYMKEIYNYYLTNTQLSNELIELLYNSVFRLIKANNDVKVAHKSGWHFEIMHDTAIVFDEYPYALAIMTNKGHSDYSAFFNKASKLIAEFHDLYWKNKSSICYNQVF